MTDRGFDWTAVSLAGGSAADVPKLLTALESTDENDWSSAVSQLEQMVVTPGAWYTAQPKIVETLLALSAGDRPAPFRLSLLRLASEILTQGRTEKLPTGLDFNDADVRKRYSEPIPAAIYRAFVDSVPWLTALLRAPEAPLRGLAAQALLFVFDAPATALGSLREAIEREKDDRALATMLYCLGLFIRYSKKAELRSVLEPYTTAQKSLVVRACALTGLLAFDRSAYGREAMPLAVEAMLAPNNWDEYRDCFLPVEGDLDKHLLRCVFSNGGGREPMNELLLAAVEHPDAPEWRVKEWLEELIKSTFERRAYALREEFSRYQLEILERVSQRELKGPFGHAGVPSVCKVRRRWLEMDPPGPLNRRVEVTIPRRRMLFREVPLEAGTYRWPIWKVLLVGFEDDPKGCVRFVTEHFSPVEVLDLHGDIAELAGDGVFSEAGDALPSLTQGIKSAGPAALEWARSTTQRMLREPKQSRRDTNWLGNVVLLPIVRSLKKDEALDPCYDVLVVPEVYEGQDPRVLPEVLAKIPLDRRQAIFVHHARSQVSVVGALRNVYEYCPTHGLTTFLLEAMDGKHPGATGECEVAEYNVERDLAAIMKVAPSHPEVADALQSYEPETQLLKDQLGGALAELKKAANAGKPKKSATPKAAAKKAPAKRAAKANKKQ